MFYVYILQSINNPEAFYIGYTANIKQRLQEHNSGQSIHTNKYRPWKIKNYFAFDDEQKARDFESYLKTHSGRKFCKNHFWQQPGHRSVLRRCFSIGEAIRSSAPSVFAGGKAAFDGVFMPPIYQHHTRTCILFPGVLLFPIARRFVCQQMRKKHLKNCWAIPA